MYRGLEKCAYNLWQVQRVISYRVEDEVLELVDDSEQVFTERGHGGGGGVGVFCPERGSVFEKACLACQPSRVLMRGCKVLPESES